MARTKSDRLKAYRAGLRAEWLAAVVLVLKGYRIVAWRYKTPVGEIDLIVRKGGYVVFVEVKVRPDLSSALTSIHQKNRERVTRAAEYFTASGRMPPGLQPRFDVFVFAPPFSWQHLDNAWFTVS